jgi:hypothetical protein
MAGMAADVVDAQRRGVVSKDDLTRISVGGSADEAACRRLIRHLNPEMVLSDAQLGRALAPMLLQAKTLLVERWPDVERVACALLERGELSGDDIRSLLAA